MGDYGRILKALSNTTDLWLMRLSLQKGNAMYREQAGLAHPVEQRFCKP
jgi:hypothetical protein